MSRKACAAVAMLGTEVDRSGRVVVLLDEITAGVDVSARRRMWRSIQDRTDSFSGILCTHHMEEAESLCTRIAILIGGVIRAEGTAQELKHQYVGWGLDSLVDNDMCITTLATPRHAPPPHPARLFSFHLCGLFFPCGRVCCRYLWFN